MMHYTPLLPPGAGLLVLGHAVPPQGIAGLIAHITLVIAGLCFLVLAAVFFTANAIGALRVRLLPIPADAPPALQREGSPW